jgi:hypothetical protein
MREIIYYIGQGLSVVGILLGFLIYQVRSQRALLIVHIITSAVFSAHYGMIGAWTGMAMNALGLVRDIALFYRNQKQSNERYTPILFTILMGVVGAFAWEAWYSIFMVLGLVIHTYALSFIDPQNVRKSILITSPLVLIYDVIVHSYGGTIYESVAIISAIIGIVRFYQKQKENTSI